MIDGFANGWYIDPAVTGQSFTVDITWSPQNYVWMGLAVSTPWFLGLCVAALILTWRRRSHLQSSRNQPELYRSTNHADLTLTERLGIVALATVLAAIVGGLVVAVAMAAITAGLVWSRRRTSLAILAVLGSVGGVVVLYTGLQFRRHFPNGVEWPSGFLFAHQLGLVAVLTVVSETLVRWFLRTRSKSTTNATEANQSSDGSALTR